MTAETYEITLEGDELNEKLGGGLPIGSLVLVEAPNGLGKSILAQRCTYGLLQNQRTVSYISTELSASGFLKQMESVNYHVKQDFLQKNLKFISIFTPMGAIEPTGDLVRRILKSKELMESNVVVFDTLSDFLVSRDRSFDDNFSLLNEFKQHAMQDTTVMCCVDPETINDKLKQMLTNAAEVYVTMKEIEEYGQTVNRISIQRFNAAQDNLDKELSFHVRPNVGIVVEIAST
jgi:flagellar protein FlaH